MTVEGRRDAFFCEGRKKAKLEVIRKDVYAFICAPEKPNRQGNNEA